MHAMNNYTAVAVAFVVLAAAVAVTWWQTGEMKEKEFSQRLKDAPHKTDTVTITIYVPQKPQHAEGKVGPSADPILSIDTTGWRDADRAEIVRISAPFDTMVVFDSGDSVRVQYDPPTRMLVLDLIRPPVPEIHTTITDSARVPVYIPDSFGKRATIFAAGAAVGAIIVTVVYAFIPK
jgi:hypothetical protein